MITLNASALPRILACTGSAALVDALDKTQVPETESAREGTVFHYAAECALKGVDIPAKHANGDDITDAMRDHALEYADAFPKESTDPRWIEQRADWQATEHVRINVKMDAAWLQTSHDCLHTIDAKYGWRIVEPEGNWQLIAGAMGVLRKLVNEDPTFVPPSRYALSIYQPRPWHSKGSWRTWRLSLNELVEWHDKLVDVLNRLDDALNTGDHCDYCPAAILGACPAFLRATYNAVDVAMRGFAVEVPPEAWGRELDILRRAGSIINDRVDWLQTLAVNKIKAGGIVPGYGLEPRKGNSTWRDWEAAKAATNIDLTATPKPCTPAEAKRRGASDEFVAEQAYRPELPPKLVKRDADAYVKGKLK